MEEHPLLMMLWIKTTPAAGPGLPGDAHTSPGRTMIIDQSHGSTNVLLLMMIIDRKHTSFVDHDHMMKDSVYSQEKVLPL